LPTESVDSLPQATAKELLFHYRKVLEKLAAVFQSWKTAAVFFWEELDVSGDVAGYSRDGLIFESSPLAKTMNN